MDAFWKWLIQANARAVLLAGVLILFLACGWWAWRLTTPPDSGAVPVSPPAEPPQKTSLGVLAFLDAELARSNSLPRNPFAPVPIVNRPQKPSDNQPPVPTPVPAPTTNTVSKPVPQKPPTETPPPRQKEIVSITYHGMLRRPDGRVLAWVENSKSGRSSFYAPGGKAELVTIGAIRESEVDVRLGDGSRITLRINEPAVFEEGRYVSP